MSDFERDITREAERLRRVAREDRPKLSLRFNQTPQSAAQERADRNYYRAIVL